MDNRCMKYLSSFIIQFLLFAGSLFAQNSTQLNSSDKNCVIEKLCNLIVENYFDPQIADSIGTILKNLNSKGLYDTISNYQSFAKILDKDLKKISRDYHFKIWYTPYKPASKKDIAKYNSNRDKFHNSGIQKLEILEGNIGYLKLDYFAKCNKRAYKTAFKYLTHTNGIIIDLNDNNGGDRDMVAVLVSYFIKGKRTIAIVKTPKNTEKIKTYRFVNSGRMEKVPMAILLSKRSFSAAEFFAYSMQKLNRAQIIGDTTLGGAHPVKNLRLNDSLSMFMPYAEVINTITNSNWEKNGVIPDIPTEEFKSLNTGHLYILNELNNQTTSAEEKKYYNKLISKLSAVHNNGYAQ